MIVSIILLLVALFLVVIGGAFVAAEFSLITVQRSQVDRLAQGGDRRARSVSHALHTLSTQLSGAQIGITLTNLAIGFLAEPAIAELIRPVLRDWGMPEESVQPTSLTIGLVAATIVTMVFGELIPKNLAIARPLGTAKAVAGFQRGFTTVMSWPIRWFNGTANTVLGWFGIEAQEELASARSAEELTALVRHSAKEGTLAIETAELVERSLAFGDRRAHDAMIPRSRIIALESEDTVAELISRARTSGHSRFPVIDFVEDEEGHHETAIRGLVHVRAALGVPYGERESRRVGTIVSPAIVCPDSLPLDELMDQLRAGGMQMALLIDEFDTLAGLVTLEDLVEEIVGEVRDEHDDDEEHAVALEEGTWTVPGLMRTDEASELLDVSVPQDEAWETLGGLITATLERFPQVGDVVELKAEPYRGGKPAALRLEVTELDGRRVNLVRVDVTRPTAEEDDDDDGAASADANVTDTGVSPAVGNGASPAVGNGARPGDEPTSDSEGGHRG